MKACIISLVIQVAYVLPSMTPAQNLIALHQNNFTNFEQLRIYKSATMPSSSDGVDASASSDMSPGQLDLLDSVLETAGRDGSLLLASVRYLLLPWFLWQAILFSED